MVSETNCVELVRSAEVDPSEKAHIYSTSIGAEEKLRSGRGEAVIDQKIAGATTPTRARLPLTSPRGREGRPRAALQRTSDNPRHGRRRRRHRRRRRRGRPLTRLPTVPTRACAPRARAADPPPLDDESESRAQSRPSAPRSLPATIDRRRFRTRIQAARWAR